MITYEEVYNAVAMFADVLEDVLQDAEKPDCRDIKALAACYELKEYLADFFAEEKAQAHIFQLFQEALKTPGGANTSV